jgi:hypothetical protein
MSATAQASAPIASPRFCAIHATSLTSTATQPVPSAPLPTTPSCAPNPSLAICCAMGSLANCAVAQLAPHHPCWHRSDATPDVPQARDPVRHPLWSLRRSPCAADCPSDRPNSRHPRNSNARRCRCPARHLRLSSRRHDPRHRHPPCRAARRRATKLPASNRLAPSPSALSHGLDRHGCQSVRCRSRGNRPRPRCPYDHRLRSTRCRLRKFRIHHSNSIAPRRRLRKRKHSLRSRRHSLHKLPAISLATYPKIETRDALHNRAGRSTSHHCGRGPYTG